MHSRNNGDELKKSSIQNGHIVDSYEGNLSGRGFHLLIAVEEERVSMVKEKPQLSQKQQYQRLTQAKAQALRNGQETPKLDRKIEKLRTLMGSAVQKSPPAKPSASKYANYKGVNKRPMQGGSVTPK